MYILMWREGGNKAEMMVLLLRKKTNVSYSFNLAGLAFLYPRYRQVDSVYIF